MAGPLETEFKEMWTARLEGSPGMLQATFEERDEMTLVEAIQMWIRMLGATRDGFLLVTREIDKLNASRS